MPKVSVILTSFNHEKFIREAIGSVLNQTFTDFELIIWDDASVDGSWAVINSYSDPRIKAFRNEEQKRGIWGINKAITEVAKGEYIAIHHSDDIWESDKLAKQVIFLDTRADIGAVFTNVKAIDEVGVPLSVGQHLYSDIFNQPNRTRWEWLNYFFIHGNALCHPSVLIRKSCYVDCGLYRFGFAQVGDLDMWTRLCLKYEIHVLPERLVRFRVRDNEANTSGSRPETRIRSLYENYKVLANYRMITSFDDLVRIFPVAKKYDKHKLSGVQDISYILAMIGLEENSNSLTQLFCHDILFEIINDPVRSDNVWRMYGFDYIGFIALTAKHDIFSHEVISSLWRQIAERDGQIASLRRSLIDRDGQIANLTQAVAEGGKQITTLNQAVAEREVQMTALVQTVTSLKSSTSWAVTRPLRLIGKLAMPLVDYSPNVLAPAKSLLGRAVFRAKLLRWYFELMRCPFFDRIWYLKHNDDVARADINPLWHYIVYGWKENRQPGPVFNGEYYRSRYLDIAGLDQPPLLHYWRHGRYEGRHMNPLLDLEWLQRDTDANIIHKSMLNESDERDIARPNDDDAIYISVVVPTYNRINLLPKVIESWRDVHKCTQFAYEIIFSDDGSSDGSVEYLESLKGLPLKVLRNSHGGASRARNSAIFAARGERLLLIGDDIFPDRDILNVHARLAMKMGPKVAILGTVDWHDDLAVNHLMHHITEHGNEQFSYNRLKDGSYVDFRHFYTCNISIDRDFLLIEDTIFDESFNEYGFEDIELGYRLSLRGMKLFYTTLAKGAHFHPYNLEGFCRRQTSAGRMAVVFATIHPGIEQMLGVDELMRRVRKYREVSQEGNALWQKRVDMLIKRCNEYEHLVSLIPNDASISIRQCLSSIYSRLFRAMYELGVLEKIGYQANALAISLAFNFEDSWDKYWNLLAINLDQPIDMDINECRFLGEALNVGRTDKLIIESSQQRALFDELTQVKMISPPVYKGIMRKNRYAHIVERIVHYLINDPRYLHYRLKQKLFQITALQVTKKKVATNSIAVRKPIIGLIIEHNNTNRNEVTELFHSTFGDAGRIYERDKVGALIPIFDDGNKGNPIKLSEAEATIYFWPTSSRALPLSGQLLSAFISIVENGLSLSVISHNLILGHTISIGEIRNYMLLSCDVADAVLGDTLGKMRLTGKILRLLPASGDIKDINIDSLIGSPLKIDHDGFFASKLMGAANPIFYNLAYIPSYKKTKKLIFVFPIFLAVGGVERNTVEIMRKLNNSYEFIVITMERLRPEQGSLAAQAIDAGAKVIEMSEIVRHSDYLNLLGRLKIAYKPDIIWVCNGSPWFCDNALAIRSIFDDIPIVDQEAYDAQAGWINRYGEPGIQSFDHYIAINRKIKNRFLRDYHIDPNRISLIYPAIDAPRIMNFKQSQPSEGFLRNKLGLPQGKAIFSFVGRLTEQKRPLSFLELAKSRHDKENECYVLVGNGELSVQVRDFIHRHSLHNVICIPHVENILELDAISSGIIFTSMYEGLPVAMLEAIAMGVPVFATDVGDISDVLLKYNGGSVIPATSTARDISDSFAKWLCDRSYYSDSLRSREQEILESYSSENIAKQYVACWAKAASMRDNVSNFKQVVAN